MSKLIDSIRTKAKLLQKAKQKTNPDYKLKDCYETLAKHAGYNSWRDWKEVLDEHSQYAPPGAAIWHVWYADYAKAQKHLEKTKNSFLIPFMKQFFICDEHYINFLGLTTNDPDLIAVGNNWVEPKNNKAWKSLLKKISTIKK